MEVYENPAAILAYLLGFDAFRELLSEEYDYLASITASATFGHSASPDNVTCWHIMALQ
jgi:hypothetical protein